MTVKEWPQDTGYVFQKSITPIQVSGQGKIEDTGTAGDGDGVASLIFELTTANTGRLVQDRAYYFDVEGVTASGAKYTAESGILYGSKNITV